ncbi:MAG: thioesterase family protein [Alphaproteobacteria bacterium]|nr:thioesterase family protein [Alphaproteobacteria bacterium]MCB9791472.1 thioesterase family protein [Alphaproteobacteria bacterium]
MTIATHPRINPALCGQPSALAEGHAVVRLVTTEAMVADDRGLVHGGFVFGQADYAAMLAVNDPNVVLGAADCRFTAPVRVGEVVEATATRAEIKGRKHVVAVEAKVGDRVVFTGTFTTFVLDRHVLD